jgi:hypothetical protein
MLSHKKFEIGNALQETIPKDPATMSTVWREGCGDACVSTPMKIPRTMNEKYAIIRAEEEQRRRKTSVKREATVSPVCRRIMLAPDVEIQTIQIPCGDTSHASQTHTPSATTPSARPFESQPNSPW